MAAVTAAPAADGRDAAPPPLHARLQACLGDAERAVAALLAVCEEPGAQAALEVRLRCAARVRNTAHRALAVVDTSVRRLRASERLTRRALLRAGKRLRVCFG